MQKNKEHLTRSVVVGYVAIVVLAVFAGVYIFNLITRIANEKNTDDSVKVKVYLITNTLSLLYECEAHTQFITTPDEDFEQFNQTLNQVLDQMGLLRSYTPDSSQWEKIDRIENLLEQKRVNTGQLLLSVKEMENIYARNLKRSVAQKEAEKEVDIIKGEALKKDTVVTQRQRRGFFKRLAEAFVADKEDSTIIVNKTSEIHTDQKTNIYTSSDTINKVLNNIQRDIAGEREALNQRLARQTNALRYNNSVITSEINQLLLEIEEEAMILSQEQDMKRQEMIEKASLHLGIIAVVSIIIVLIFLFIAIRDISRSRFYRRQLEKAKLYTENLLESREKLMLTISHDIRAPLSSVLGYVGLLKKKPEDDSMQYLTNIEVAAGHILALVNDLLDFHRLDSGKMDINPVPFKVATLFDELHNGFKPMADTKGLKLKTSVGEGAELVCRGDTVRIKQVAGNLLSNAIKFTSKGIVAMNIAVEDDNEGAKLLKIAIKDEGPGIDTAEQEKIFNEFTRLAGAEKTDGFGLGLSITGKLVSLMDGRITLQSEPGKGSEFTVTLPLVLSEDELSEDVQTNDTADAIELQPLMTGKINCLIVDDDMLQLKLTEALLKGSVNVIGIPDAGMALDVLGNGKFDVILTDIQMPGMDGFELLGKIRSSDIPGADVIPVIALSASNAEKESYYVEAGFTSFLVKPFTANQLLSLLGKIFEVEPEAAKPLNISSLTLFAENDTEASNSILKTFEEESEKNIALLKEALSNEDKKLAARICHKMIPLFTMLEANSLVQQLRVLEKEEEKLSTDYWKQLLEKAITQTISIIEEVKRKS